MCINIQMQYEYDSSSNYNILAYHSFVILPRLFSGNYFYLVLIIKTQDQNVIILILPLVKVYFGHACSQGSKCTSVVKFVVHSVLVCKWDSIIWLEVAVVLTWNSHFPGALKHVCLSYRLTGGHFGIYIHFSKPLGSHGEPFISGYRV